MHLHLITAEDPLTLQAQARELIRFPQLTMPLLAALTPSQWQVSHTDEITSCVDTARTYDLVGITAATPGAPHAYELAQAFRLKGVKVVMGGPHATLMPYEVAQHVDIVVVGEAETLLIEQAHEYGIAIQAGIMFGFDGDDKDVFARTVDIMGEIGLDNATISLMVPYPGTPAYAPTLGGEESILNLIAKQLLVTNPTRKPVSAKSLSWLSAYAKLSL